MGNLHFVFSEYLLFLDHFVIIPTFHTWRHELWIMTANFQVILALTVYVLNPQLLRFAPQELLKTHYMPSVA